MNPLVTKVIAKYSKKDFLKNISKNMPIKTKKGLKIIKASLNILEWNRKSSLF